MALDSAQKRYSVMNMMCSWRVTSLPFPDASVDVGDRQQLMLLGMAQTAVELTPAGGGAGPTPPFWLFEDDDLEA